jgi:hypothetical protein
MNEKPACRHTRTRLVARDDSTEYVECLDCGALLDAEEIRARARSEPAGFDESLSDA